MLKGFQHAVLCIFLHPTLHTSSYKDHAVGLLSSKILTKFVNHVVADVREGKLILLRLCFTWLNCMNSVNLLGKFEGHSDNCLLVYV